jgi:CBS domain containing-hemolysin-like protein
MLEISLIVLAAIAAIICAVLQKAYSQMGKNKNFSPKLAPNNQRALRYIADNKESANIFLAVCQALFLASAAVLIGRQAGLWAIAISFLLFGLVWLAVPRTKASKATEKLSFAVAPGLRSVLEKLQPAAKQLKVFIPGRLWQTQTDTGVYTRDDLAEFIKRQKHAAGNSISGRELSGLQKRIEFENKKIKDLMQTKKEARIVGASEAIGPVLINELHETGQKYFLVEEEFNKEIIGTLDISGLVGLKQTGDVKSAMDKRLFYLNEKGLLFDVIEGFSKTGSAVFVVVNSDEEIKGIINIGDVLAEVFGNKKISGFSMFDSLESVAETNLEDERTAD